MDYAGEIIDGIGARAAGNPMATGGSVSFAVVMFFVSTNALYYQPFAHKDAFFQTRSMDSYVAPVLPKLSSNAVAPGTKSESFKIAQDDAPLQVTNKDLQLVDIQSALANLNLYSGTIDGLPGPKTRQAIASFQQQAGLEPTGEVDPLLIDAIRTASIPAAKVPAPKLKTVAAQPLPDVPAVESGDALSDGDIKKLQAGLKAFGNESIEIDGKIGGKTKQAILEFQGLFQLNQTGEADRATLEKLQEIGLVSG
jgi:peptidoglycan hydrolase-like protein with peptidoglycan-binding domain